MKAQTSRLSPESRLNAYVGRGDFVDCFEVDIDQTDVPLEDVVQHIFLDLPVWIRLLLRVRDCAVAPLRLKTTQNLPTVSEVQASLTVGEPVNFLNVREKYENEVILGEDDWHLDFRISIHRIAGKPDCVSMASWVRPHNCFGRMYLKAILPFHTAIAKSQLAATASHYRSA